MSAAGRALRIGTRGSELALRQAREVAARLAAEAPDAAPCELVVVRTTGDRLQETPLAELDGKDAWTRELGQALAAGEVDLVVHSLKDLAATRPDGLVLAACLERGDPADALLLPRPSPRAGGGSLESLAPGTRIGTSSLRRRAFVARSRPDLEVVELRGNVPTRIARLDEGRVDALVLAAAGLLRLGLAERIDARLPPERFPPAPGQGAIAVEARSDDAETVRRLAALDDAATRAATTAERALMRRLEGGCRVPLGALAEVRGARLRLHAAIASPDGTEAVEGRLEGEAEAAEEIGEALAEELLARGAGAILERLRPAGESP